MDMRFSTHDILQVAENVEQREIDFYLRAANRLDDQEFKDLCVRLAAWSLRQKKAWERHREALGPDQHANSEENIFSHPGAMAGLTWFGLRASSDQRAEKWTCREYLLWEARQRANDLLTFYEGLKGFVRDTDAFMMIDSIISKEEQHFEYIERLLRMKPVSKNPDHQEIA